MNTKPFRQAMQAANLETDAVIRADGSLHRFHVAGDRSGSKNGWYVLHSDDPAAGCFGCFKRGISQKWSARDSSILSSAERASYATRMELARQQRDEELAKIRASCRAQCAKLWENASDATDAHPYLQRKGVHAYGLRLRGNSLMVPVHDTAQTIHGLQFISPNGDKIYKEGTAILGHYFLIGKPVGNTLLICEGYATGASLHEVTGHAVAVAFGSGNLKPVGEALRAELPGNVLIFCADDDHATIGNPGLSKATEAALAVNGLLAVPVFSHARGSKDTDFNDMAKMTTSDAVRACIGAATSPSVEGCSEVELCSQNLEGFPEPILFGEIYTPEIPCSLLPGWLGEYAAAVALTTQTPPAMATMMALAVVAACSQKRFQVARTPEHIEPMSLWTVTALPPASRKTAVVNAFTTPLTEWERERGESEKRERARIAGVREAMETRIKALLARAGKANDNEGRNGLVEDASKLREEMPEPLFPPRIFTGDVTPERLQAMLMEQGERMSVLSDEGGIFTVMAGLYSGGKANIDVFLKGHAGSAVRVDRQDRTAHLDEPALTFGLCIQPGIIQRLSETSFRGNGCLARFLFCLPVSNIGTRTAQTIPIPSSVSAAYQAGIKALLNISPVLDERGKEKPRTITLDHGAAQAWEAFFAFVESSMGEGKELESIQDWAGKLMGAALRIAGIMTIVEYGENAREISEGAMTRALKMCELLISHAKAAFDLIGGDDAQHDAKYIYRWILEKGLTTIKLADIYRELRRFTEAERLNKALKVLADRHIISEPMKSRTGGRSAKFFKVNPAIFRTGSM